MVMFTKAANPFYTKPGKSIPLPTTSHPGYFRSSLMLPSSLQLDPTLREIQNSLSLLYQK